MLGLTGFARWIIEADEKAKKKREERGQVRLSKASFHNRVDALVGEMLGMMDTYGTNIVTRVSEIYSKHLTDFTKVIPQYVETELLKMQRWIDDTFKLYEVYIDGTLRGFFDVFKEHIQEFRQEAEHKASKRHNMLVNYMIGMAQNLMAKDKNDTERYLEILKRVEQLELREEHNSNVNFNTMIALHGNLTEQIQALRKPHRHVPANVPPLDWLAEHADEIIQLGNALANMKENNLPQCGARTQVIKSIRAFAEYSIKEIDDAFKPVAVQWGLG